MFKMMELPLSAEVGAESVTVAVPTLGSIYMTENTKRYGVVREVNMSYTKGGYGIVNIGFDTVDINTGVETREWACISPMA